MDKKVFLARQYLILKISTLSYRPYNTEHKI